MYKKVLAVLVLMAASTMAQAWTGWHHGGYVKRVLSEGPNFGGCMIQVTSLLPMQCSANGTTKTNWISLDCDKKYYTDGPRKYSTALMAMSTNMRVSFWIDNTKRHAGHCVARRMDIYK